MIRIGVFIDVPGDDPAEAYRLVCTKLAATKLEWESSDEWFDFNGIMLNPEEVQQIIDQVLSEEPPP